MNEEQLKQIEKYALNLGFDALGWTNDLIPLHADYLRQWVRDKKYGDMTWYERSLASRLDPTQIDPQIKSALVLLTSYNHAPSTDSTVKQARYSFGEDYHVWIEKRLELLIAFVRRKIDSDFIGRPSTDSGPVLERDLAVKADLGWIGKNTCLIHPKLGSFVFISVILMNVDLSCRDATHRVSNHCGTCTKCLNACPTHALDPYRLNQEQCLAYQANAKKGERSCNLWPHFGESILGCDICQEVCPWNIKAPKTRQKEWLDTFKQYAMTDLSDLLRMTEADFKKRFKDSVLSRPYLDLMRNIFLVIAFKKRVDLLEDVIKWNEMHSELNVAECHYCLEALK